MDVIACYSVRFRVRRHSRQPRPKVECFSGPACHDLFSADAPVIRGVSVAEDLPSVSQSSCAPGRATQEEASPWESTLRFDILWSLDVRNSLAQQTRGSQAC